jgi:hypothetical protein
MKTENNINAINKLLNKIDDLRDQMNHSEKFTQETLVLVDVLLYAADAMSKELGDKSTAKLQYEVIKAKFDIK